MSSETTTTKTTNVDHQTCVEFRFDGRRYLAYEGDTIASALYRAGVRSFSRGFKYHRPRGLFCLSGACPNCLVNVNGTPSVHACMTSVEEGMIVESQNAWPSRERDLMSVVDKMDRLLPVGFYYKTFIRPRALWPVYETVLRRAAGLGVVDPDPDRFEESYCDKQYRHTEVTVVGGGPAGLAAAVEAADLGVHVLLIEEHPYLGGHLRYAPRTRHHVDDLIDRVQLHDHVDVLTAATAFGWYDDNWIGVSQGNRLIKLRTEQLVVATGRIEQPLVFHNNDLPGVMLGSGVQRLMHLYDIVPARRAVVVTTNDAGWTVARDLLDAHVDVALVADARPTIPETETTDAVLAAGVAVLPGYTVKAAIGSEAVEGAVLVRLDEDAPCGRAVPGTEVEVHCDLISLSTGFVANNALLYQSGADIRYDATIDDFVVSDLPTGVRGAGHAVGTRGLDALMLDGMIAGTAAASDVARVAETLDVHEVQARIETWRGRRTESLGRYRETHSVRPPASVAGDAKKFVCFCEDVTEKDLQAAIAEGFDSIETLKRYSTISMGPCQGKMCSLNSIRLCARETHRSIEETGRTTSRPPIRPVKLGVLAGRNFSPVRYTSIHERHRALGATMMNAGQWKRPEYYDDPDDEVRAVHAAAGIIDVSTLGKLDVRGPDAVAFLERIYTNRLADLAAGRIRYGVMCTEEGIIFDDGVVCRVDDDHFYLTTTSSGITGVYEWLTWWRATWDVQVHVTDVTTSYGAINLAGPRARDVLTPLTDLDLSTDSLPYMHWRAGTVAGVPARLLRIGFVGEMGYEIHFPAEYGTHLWDSLMEAGARYGIRPFGIEAQRRLRLEKKHIIVGHDTDALSDPFGAGMSWIVKLEKEWFVGKPSLLQRKRWGPRERLIGFEMIDAAIVPDEGTQIVENGSIVGRVTSARYSRVLGKSIGMGWVLPERAHAGARIRIQTPEHMAEATVVTAPFYDPKGERLKR